MENNKSEFSEIIGAVSKFAGALVGSVVIAGKKVGDYIKELMAAEPKQSVQAAAKTVTADKEDEPVVGASDLASEVEEKAVQPQSKK